MRSKLTNRHRTLENGKNQVKLGKWLQSFILESVVAAFSVCKHLKIEILRIKGQKLKSNPVNV